MDRSGLIVEGVIEQLDEARAFREAVLRALTVGRESDVRRQVEMIAADIVTLLDADLVRIYEAGDQGVLSLLPGQDADSLPPDARRMELELVARASTIGKSLISTHPALDSVLAPLAVRCASQGLVTHVLLAGVSGEVHGAFCAHWIVRERPGGARRKAFYYYWDMARYAMAASMQLARIEARLAEVHRHAYVDQLTGLPSGLALDDQLRAHHGTHPLSVLVLDFDGMREANSEFGYEDGGDVLIRTVGQALAELTRDPEFPARLHRGGDEFAVILPEMDADTALARAGAIETGLDTLRVPDTHRHVYHGASVGAATRNLDESPGQTLGRAITAMTDRKRARRTERPRHDPARDMR